MQQYRNKSRNALRACAVGGWRLGEIEIQTSPVQITNRQWLDFNDFLDFDF